MIHDEMVPAFEQTPSCLVFEPHLRVTGIREAGTEVLVPVLKE